MVARLKEVYETYAIIQSIYFGADTQAPILDNIYN